MKQYKELLQAIIDKGTHKPAAREGMPGTISLFGYQFRHDLAEGFPLPTTKKVYFKGVVTELLWFLRGDTNIKYLIDNGANFWNEDAYNYYCKKMKELDVFFHNNQRWHPVEFDEFIQIIKDGNLESTIPNYKFGDCGFQYGKVWRAWENIVPGKFPEPAPYHINTIDQIANLIKGLKNNPESRRHLVTAVDPAHDQDLALFWCHSLFQFNCRPLSQYERKVLLSERPEWEGQFHNIDEDPSGDIMEIIDDAGIPKYYLDCQLYQRSADVFLGVPFNTASYALLTHILCKICNFLPGEYIHTFGDVHIYEDHLSAVEEQLSREPRKLPTIHLRDCLVEDVWNIKKVDTWNNDLFVLEDYDPHPAIHAKLSTGLNK